MVYYGSISKGCQRCRKLKVKCDQRKPGCIRCERAKRQCPGYRDLNNVIFRDETERIVRKVRRHDTSTTELRILNGEDLPLSSTQSAVISESQSAKTDITPPPVTTSPPYQLTQPVNEIAVQFFFAKFASRQAPHPTDYHDWLAESYSAGGLSCHALKIAIEAVGMAAASNVCLSPTLSHESRLHYCRALKALKRVLDDSSEATSDTTLMTVILLGMYERVSFSSTDRYRFWALHVKGATTLLELRGQEQFMYERGAQLFVQARSQILSLCFQERQPVPTALVKIASDFGVSSVRQQWRQRQISSPRSIFAISVQLVNLWATLGHAQVDYETVYKEACDIGVALEAWRDELPAEWDYKVVECVGQGLSIPFHNKRHTYPHCWTAEVFNNWRMMRILLNRIVLQIHSVSCDANISQAQAAEAASIIQKMSLDICISTHNILYTTRILSLISPLGVVALEEENSVNVRSFAVDCLETINAIVGVRHAGSLAEIVTKSLNQLPT